MRLLALTDHFCVLVATGLYLSYIPCCLTQGLLSPSRWTGSGFIGTVLGWGSVYFLPETGVEVAVFLFCAILLASLASGRAERYYGVHDDPRIIVDEIVGYWTAVAYLPRSPVVLIAAFVLFRILDVWKLPPYRWLDQLPGGLGVVMDDIGAGVFTNVALRLIFLPLASIG